MTSDTNGAKEILRVSDLRTYFPVRSRGMIRRTIGHVKAVDGIDFTLEPGETLGSWVRAVLARQRRPARS